MNEPSWLYDESELPRRMRALLHIDDIPLIAAALRRAYLRHRNADNFHCARNPDDDGPPARCEGTNLRRCGRFMTIGMWVCTRCEAELAATAFRSLRGMVYTECPCGCGFAGVCEAQFDRVRRANEDIPF